MCLITKMREFLRRQPLSFWAQPDKLPINFVPHVSGNTLEWLHGPAGPFWNADGSFTVGPYCGLETCPECNSNLKPDEEKGSNS